MPVLKNARHERFAQELAKGRSAVDAHEAAGFKRNDGNASKLASKPDIQARVKEITGAAAEKAGVTVAAIVEELAKIGFSNMLDYMTIGEDGQHFLDFSKLTRDQAAAIQELIVETRADPAAVPDGEVDEEDEPQDHGGSLKRRRARDDDGRPVPEIIKVRFKLADKRAALVDLGKHVGMFKGNHLHDLTDPLKQLFAAVCGTAVRPRDGK